MALVVDALSLTAQNHNPEARHFVSSAPFLYNSTFNMAKTSESKKAVGIVSKPNKPEVAQIVPGLAEWLRRNRYEFIVDPETAPYAPGTETVVKNRVLSFGST